MSLNPLNQHQIPEKSILDINGRQTYLGNSFILPHNGFSTSDTNEDPMIVISNPATSTVSLFMFSRKTWSTNNLAEIRFYTNPTVNVAGATTTPINLRSGSAYTSQALCYESATITSNGTFAIALPAFSTSLSVSHILVILDPGSSMLVTCKQSGSGTSKYYASLNWFEI
jgi:hypothetical protein